MSFRQCAEKQREYEAHCKLLHEWDFGDFGCDQPFLLRAFDGLPANAAGTEAAPGVGTMGAVIELLPTTREHAAALADGVSSCRTGIDF